MHSYSDATVSRLQFIIIILIVSALYVLFPCQRTAAKIILETGNAKGN